MWYCVRRFYLQSRRPEWTCLEVGYVKALIFQHPSHAAAPAEKKLDFPHRQEARGSAFYKASDLGGAPNGFRLVYVPDLTGLRLQPFTRIWILPNTVASGNSGYNELK